MLTDVFGDLGLDERDSAVRSLDHGQVDGDADFTDARLDGSVDFTATDIAGHALFHQTLFGRSVELATARIRGQVILDGARTTDPHGHPRPLRQWPAGWQLAATNAATV